MQAVDERLTLSDVMEHMRVKTRNTVFQRVKDGLLAPPVRDGRFIRWYRSDLEAYDQQLKSRRNPPMPASSECVHP